MTASTGTVGRELGRGLPITEVDFQQQIIDLARLCGWFVHAERPARTQDGWRTAIQGDAGFPDLVMIRGKRVLFVELKSATGRLSQAQRRWLVALRSSGADVCVWRSVDWPEAEAMLRRPVT